MHLYVAIVPPEGVCEAVADVVRGADTAAEASPSAQGGPAGRLLFARRRKRGDARPALPAPTLHLSGSAALEFPGDQSVWARVHGDLEDLRLIPPQITRIVEPLGFFVDRRQFRPLLSVATITDATNIEVLQRVVDELDAFRGESWTVGHVSLMERRLDRDSRSFEEIEQIPLAPA